MTSFIKGRLCALVGLAMVLTFLLGVAAPARAQSSASLVLQEARALYDGAKFTAAVDRLTEAIRNGEVAGDDLNAARELLARSLAKAGRRLEAKETWKSILRSDAAYAPDAAAVPPDELAVFGQAKAEHDAEMLELGRRRPASIAGNFGLGQAVNQDLVDLASSAGAAQADEFNASTEIGFSVRFPLRPRWSVEFEISRLEAETEDKLPADRNNHALYNARSLPMVGSVYYLVVDRPKVDITGFAGAGILPSQATIRFNKSLISGHLVPTNLLGEATGYYLHIGAEGEYHLATRVAVSARLLARRASSGELDWPSKEFEIYQSFPQSVLGERSVNFSGIALHVGLRAYIGY